MQDRRVEATHLGELGIRVQRVLVAGQTVDQRLLRKRARLRDDVGCALRRLVARLGTGLTTKATLAAREHGEVVGEELLSGALLLRIHLEHDQGRLALVVEARDATLTHHLGSHRNRLVDLDHLLSVEDHGEVDLDARNRGHVHQGAEHRNHGEAGEHLQILLVGVLQLLWIGRLLHSGPDTEVV